MCSDTTSNSKPPAQTVANVGGIPPPNFDAPTLWQTQSFAPLWFADAKGEAADGSRSARRREVLFAISVVESFLFEWVRDVILQHDFVELNRYFPAGERRGVREKVKEITKELASAGLIKAAPDFGSTTWNEFCVLVEYRNGLLHARASRPITTGLPTELRPIPTVEDLDSMPPGHALRVVATLIQDLVSAAGHAAPAWLYAP